MTEEKKGLDKFADHVIDQMVESTGIPKEIILGDQPGKVHAKCCICGVDVVVENEDVVYNIPSPLNAKIRKTEVDVVCEDCFKILDHENPPTAEFFENMNAFRKRKGFDGFYDPQTGRLYHT